MYCAHASKTILLNQKRVIFDRSVYFNFNGTCCLILLQNVMFFPLFSSQGRSDVTFSRRVFSLILTGMLVRTWPCVYVMMSESIFVNMLCIELFWWPCSLMDVNLSFLEGNREEGRSCVCMELLCRGQGTENG